MKESITKMMTRNIRNMAASIVLLASATAVFAQMPKATTNLKMNPTLLDFAGSRATGTMYMPDGVNLTDQKPACVTKEPKYIGQPLYGTFVLGDGPHAVHALVIDQPTEGDPKIYFDAKGNGDLTSGGDGAWQTKTADNGNTQYSGTYVFRVSYGTKTHETGSCQYGLNFYYEPGRTSIFYYRAGERTGNIKLDNQEYSVKVIDNNNKALYNQPFTVDGKPTKPVWLVLDGNMIDARGTFPLNGMNYEANLSEDGSKLTLQATAKAVTPPANAAAKDPDLLSAGTMAPDFEVPTYGGGTVRLSDLRGKIVVLDFWATWCGPCKASLPHLEKVYQQVKGQNVYVLALNVFDDKAAYEQFIPANSQYKFNFAYDPAGRGDGSIAKQLYNVTGIPTTYVIGPDGKIVASVLGFSGINDHRLEQALSKLDVKTTE